MRVKKFGGKRKGYKGKKWFDKYGINWLTPLGTGKSGLRRTGDTAQLLASIAMMPWPFKHGGRVRGVGKAKRGYGRAMRKK
jgi:hypothetical protein